ncbi:fructokinase, partial [termite gut metagenome]
MRKVIGIGETILDIIFRGEQPSVAVPGGSVFNGIISLGRVGAEVCFISETGNDRVGNTILRFMCENNVPTDCMSVFPDGKSPISLAFLGEDNDAEYLFYEKYPKQRLDIVFPKIYEDDIVIFGSFYALNPVLREKMLELLNMAREKKAIVYYDPNFRISHKDEAMRLAPTIIENLEYANIVRGSIDDFLYMYNLRDADKIYKDKIKFYCPTFLYTAGAGTISLRTSSISKEYLAKQVETVSTIGAGDNFNAGLIYG